MSKNNSAAHTEQPVKSWRAVLNVFGLLLMARLGVYIPLPGIDQLQFYQSIGNSSSISSLLSASGSVQIGVFALGIMPYLNAMVIMALLCKVVPCLKRWDNQDGVEGHNKIVRMTRYLALVWAILNSLGISLWLRGFSTDSDSNFVVSNTIALTTGAIFSMWIAERITHQRQNLNSEKAVALLIFWGLGAKVPSILQYALEHNSFSAYSLKLNPWILLALIMIAIWIGIIFVIVLEGAEYRMPIVFASQQTAQKQKLSPKLKDRSYLPIRINHNGYYPIIMVIALFKLAPAIAQLGLFNGNPLVQQMLNPVLSPALTYSNGLPWEYMGFNAALIMIVSYVYSASTFKSKKIARDLAERGAIVLGVSSHASVSKYLSKVVNLLSIIQAITLAILSTISITVFSLLHFDMEQILILSGIGVVLWRSRKSQANPQPMLLSP